MAAIERMMQKRQAMIPKHKVIERNGQRIYVRTEEGGNERILHVWRYESCLERLQKAQNEGKLMEAFAVLQETLTGYKDGPDKMLAEWYEECFNRCSLAYDELTAESLEDFGIPDELEEFGV